MKTGRKKKRYIAQYHVYILKIHVPNNFIYFTGTHTNERVHIKHIRMLA